MTAGAPRTSENSGMTFTTTAGQARVCRLLAPLPVHAFFDFVPARQ